MPLRDIITPHPRVLFVGINPSLRSEQVGHHFASPGNPFWKLLYASKLIPEPLTSDEDKRLAEFGMAMTNLCARIALGSGAHARGDRRRQSYPREKDSAHRSRGLAFRRPQHLSRFLRQDGQPRRRRQGGNDIRARVFVLPNPSGLNASFPGFKGRADLVRKAPRVHRHAISSQAKWRSMISHEAKMETAAIAEFLGGPKVLGETIRKPNDLRDWFARAFLRIQ